MLASKEWETLGDIAKRTGVRGEEVIEDARQALRDKAVSFRFIDCGGVKIMQIKKEDSKNGKSVSSNE